MDNRTKVNSDLDTYIDYATSLPNRFLLSCFSCLSILGSSLIIVSYIRWKDIRTTSRRILVCLSISDLLVSCGYLAGSLIAKWQREIGSTCVAQSFIASSAGIASFMWSASLAIYLYCTLVKKRKALADKLVAVFHAINWTTGPIMNFVAYKQDMLGNSLDKVTGGWCWIRYYSYQHKKRDEEIVWLLFTGKFWEFVACFVILFLYVSVKLRIGKEVSSVLSLHTGGSNGRNPGGALGHFTQGDLHPRLKTLPPKISLNFCRTPKNISKDCRFFPNFAGISKNCLHSCVFASLTQNYKITESISLDPKISNTVTQKYRMDTPVSLTLRLPGGSSQSPKGFSSITFDWHKL